MIANWQSNGDTLSGDDPHMNFIQLYHDSPRGLRQLQLDWGFIPVLFRIYSLQRRIRRARLHSLSLVTLHSLTLMASECTKLWLSWTGKDLGSLATDREES